MARIRTIKPEFFLNEQLSGCELADRLLFIGLWTQADRAGRLEDRPLRLKAALFPYDDLNIDQALGRLANAGLICRYEGTSGQRLIAIPTWGKHQQPHIREKASDLPPPPCQHSAGTIQTPVEPVGREGKGREGNSTSALRARFDRFWAEYPKRVGKDAAWRSWQRLNPADDLTDQMLAAVVRHAQQPQWTKDDGQFIPNPATWLNQGRWQDEPIRLTPTARRRSVPADAPTLDRQDAAIAQQLDAARRRQAGV